MLFCDLVGLAPASLDPEDLRDVIGKFHALVAQIVRAQAGFVAQYLGHGALVYFGYPVAHEDDAERAVRAALLLRDAAQGVAVNGLDLQMRAGLATGLVIVGDRSEGSQASHERRIMGETPNLAARLQAIADPGAIIIDAATRRLTGGLFELAERPPATVKGFERLIQSWNVISEAPVESRFEALRSGAAPLVGRDEELELLERRWQQVKAGSGRVVMISGEAGLGKSRLISAFEERIKREDALELRYFCSPQHASTALYPITTHLTRAANFAASDTPAQKLAKLGAFAARPEDVPFIADLLSVPVGPEARLNDLAPQEKRQKAFAALLGRIEQLASGQPLFILFEDMHWSDPTTKELAHLLISEIGHKSILVLLTHRPEFRPAWVGQANVTSLALTRLRSEDRDVLIRSLIGNAGFSPETIAEIAERTDGIPLFAEELTRALIESGNTRLLNTTARNADHVPATLQASLMARLDHLGAEARETAQIGSVIGREFTYSLLKALAAQSGALRAEIIDPALNALTESGLVLARGAPPLSTYTFKHALVQDAAHSTLLRTQRQTLHAVLTSILEADERTAPEVLAYHLTEAGEHEKAARQWLKAAIGAIEQSAVREALQGLDQATELLQLLPETEIRDKLQLEVEAARIIPTVMTAGFASLETRAVLDRAESLANQIGAEPPMLVLFHRFTETSSRSDLRTGLALALQFAERAEGDLTIVAHRLLGGAYMSLGRLQEAASEFEAVLAEDAARSVKLRFAFGYDPHASAFVTMALTLLVLGYPDRAAHARDQALEREEQLAHAMTTAWVLSISLIQALVIDDHGLIERLGTRLLEHSKKFKMAHFERLARASLAYLTGVRGDPSTALREIEECLAEWLALGYGYLLPIIWIAQIRMQLMLPNNTDAAFATLNTALKHVQDTGEAILAAELHRMQGEIMLAPSERDDAAAERSFLRAIETARGQNAKLFELRAATDLARLWRDQGRASEAEALLAPTYAWFTEGFATRDLVAAKAVLDDLVC